jgi:hypothetical protein
MTEYMFCPKCNTDTMHINGLCKGCAINEATKIKRRDLLDKPLTSDKMLYDKECSAEVKQNYRENALNE